MIWTPLIVSILVFLWIALERFIDKRTPKIVNKVSRILSATLATMLFISAAIMLSKNAILTEGGRRVFDSVASVALLLCSGLMIACSIVELYNGKRVRDKIIKSTGQSFPHGY